MRCECGDGVHGISSVTGGRIGIEQRLGVAGETCGGGVHGEAGLKQRLLIEAAGEDGLTVR